ncbi:hypothetical protein M7I_0648 [Glarea lozoyensis 74030]|uniref:Uncharacterized protein n=1 Tax=Glarea lozoyensis (strain ATCC 74030 / MF5533) TaxID=1104152 RepID=H0EDJ9_GLAL7|nr:hypothetical protein M7I_0648 [Glarea lozoyensis 74030]
MTPKSLMDILKKDKNLTDTGIHPRKLSGSSGKASAACNWRFLAA